MRNIYTILSYLLVGACSVSLAVLLASSILDVSTAQQPQNVNTQDPNLSPEKPQNEILAETAVYADEGADLFLEPYIYDPRGRRDPFAPVDTAVIQAATGQPIRPLLPLEKYELEQIKLIGIIWDVNDPKAMFMDPTSKVHVLSKDQRIGRNQGYIAVIREGEVVVVEATQKDNQPVYRSRVMKITN
ncbi:MAG: pilus assembly protein PilP [Bdellovibrionales bacterium]|nr:pilus assembly protein PilP [Bdellovibrionales bacterium]